MRTARLCGVGSRIFSLVVAMLWFCSGCQSVLEDNEYCKKHDLPEFWTKHEIPSVPGFEACSDFLGTPGKERIKLLHYNTSTEEDNDLYDHYPAAMEAFKTRGWTVEQPFRRSVNAGFYSLKNGDYFIVNVENCYEGQKIYTKRPCTTIEIARTEGAPKPK